MGRRNPGTFFGSGIAIFFSKLKMAAKDLDLVLTDALSVSSAGSEPSISKDGKLILVNLGNAPGLPAAQLYANEKGKFKLLSQLIGEATFPEPTDSWASPDFTRFSGIDSTGTNAPNNTRIRITDRNFNVLATALFSTGDAPIVGSILGGFFSPDGKYVTLQYTINNTTPNSQQTIFLLLKVSDLSTVFQTTLPGFDINTSRLFSVNGKLYLSYQESHGNSGALSTIMPPYFSSVYRVKKDSLKLIDKQPLPRFAEKDVVSYGDYAIISHGGFCSLFPNRVSIYDTNAGETTSLPNDNAEARAFSFDGKKMKLLFKEAVNCCNRTVIYPPAKGAAYLVGQNTLVGNAGNPDLTIIDREFFCLASLVEDEDGNRKLKGENLPQQDCFKAIPVISENGKWLFRAGVYGYVGGDPTADATKIHNLLLYKIKSQKYKPVKIHS